MRHLRRGCVRMPLLVGFAVATALGVTRPQASCGSAGCFLITGTQEAVNSPGEVTLDFSFRYIPQDRKLAGTDEVDEVLVPKVNFEDGEIEPDHHREISTYNYLVSASISIGVSQRVSVGVDLPLYLDREHEHFDEVGTPEETFTNQDGTTGFGDIRLSGRWAALSGTKDLVTLGGGIKVPTGPYRLLDSEGSINEPTIQPGTGSWDPFLTFYYDHQWVPARWEYFLSGSYTLRTENPLDYDFGNLTLVNAGVRFSPNTRCVLSVQLNGQASPHDFFDGHLVASTGSRLISLTPGIMLYGGSGLGFYFHAAIPVYQDVNEAQLAPRTALIAGLSLSF